MVFTQYSNLASVLEKKCSSKMCIQQQQQKMAAGGWGGVGGGDKKGSTKFCIHKRWPER